MKHPSQAIIERYLKVWALALRGEEGEQASAKRRMEEMRAKYPGIHKIAEDLRSGNIPRGGATEGSAMWEMLATAASSLFETYTAATSLNAGQRAARRLRPFLERDETPSGQPRYSVGVRFGQGTLDALLELDPLELEGFAERAVEAFQAALDGLLESVEDEELDELA